MGGGKFSGVLLVGNTKCFSGKLEGEVKEEKSDMYLALIVLGIAFLLGIFVGKL